MYAELIQILRCRRNGGRMNLPIASYSGVYPFNERQLTEWALLDTFGMLAPRYDKPQGQIRWASGSVPSTNTLISLMDAP